jgi:hypothetical protein
MFGVVHEGSWECLGSLVLVRMKGSDSLVPVRMGFTRGFGASAVDYPRATGTVGARRLAGVLTVGPGIMPSPLTRNTNPLSAARYSLRPRVFVSNLTRWAYANPESLKRDQVRRSFPPVDDAEDAAERETTEMATWITGGCISAGKVLPDTKLASLTPGETSVGYQLWEDGRCMAWRGRWGAYSTTSILDENLRGLIWWASAADTLSDLFPVKGGGKMVYKLVTCG